MALYQLWVEWEDQGQAFCIYSRPPYKVTKLISRIKTFCSADAVLTLWIDSTMFYSFNFNYRSLIIVNGIS